VLCITKQGWRLDARLKTLLCKRIAFAKSKEVKPGSNLREFPQEGYGSTSVVLPMIMMN
jgi:hypothetical protein